MVSEEFQISHIKRNGEYQMAQSHSHEYYELYYLVDGSSKMFIGHSLHYIEAGGLLLLRPEALHRASYTGDRTAERITVSFHPKLLSPLLEVCSREETELLLGQQVIVVPVLFRPFIEHLADKIEEELKAGDRLSVFLAGNHLYEILSTAVRHGHKQAESRPDATEVLIQKAARYICRNYDKTLTLAEMAEFSHMTPSYFSRCFKKITGFGFKEYVIYVRVAQAEKLLSQTAKTVTEIASDCGFGDGNYFGDTFKRVKGMSPRAYRQMNGRITIT